MNRVMRKFVSPMLMLGAIFMSIGGASAQERVVVSSWGGTFQDILREVVFVPFEKETGIKVIEATGPTYAKINSMVRSGNIEWDVATLVASDFVTAAKKNLLEKIDYSQMKPGALDGVEVGKEEYGLAYVAFSKVVAYSTKAFPGDAHPRTWQDVWDTAKFPGPRTLDAGNYSVPPIEYALLADGVSPKELYPLDLKRAYKALDRIRPRVAKWATTAAMQPQAIVDGEAVIGAVTAGRAAELNQNGAPINFSWEGGLINYDYLSIPKGAPNYQNAIKLIEFVLRPDVQAKMVSVQTLGPNNKRAFEHMSAERAKLLPTFPENLAKQIMYQPAWWAEVDASGKSNLELNQEMWQSWILK